VRNEGSLTCALVAKLLGYAWKLSQLGRPGPKQPHTDCRPEELISDDLYEPWLDSPGGCAPPKLN